MGLLRLFLALVVAHDHLQILGLGALHMYGEQWKLGFNGGTAVMSFYVISGFLISLVLDKRYGFDRGGIRKFYAARASRIYALYWPLLIAMLALNFDNARTILHSGWGVLGFTLLGADWAVSFAYYPHSFFGMFPNAMAQAWTLGAEMTFYLLAPFLLRSSRTAAAVMAVSLVLHVALFYGIGYMNAWCYTFFPSTLWCFLLGALAQRIGSEFAYRRLLSAAVLPILVISSFKASVAAQWDNPWTWLMIPCLATALPGLFAATSRIRWMNALGDLSYPVYLIHVAVIYIIFLQPGWLRPIGEELISLGKRMPTRDLGADLVFSITAIVCVVAAYLIHRYIESPLRSALMRLLNSPNQQAKLLPTVVQAVVVSE